MFSNIVSVIALIISIGVPLVEHFSNKRINSISIDSHYYNEIYEQYLLVEIPEKRLKLERKPTGDVVGCTEFLDMLRDIRKKSLCFKFVNEDFYKILYVHIQNLEDELTMMPEKMDEEEFIADLRKIDGIIYDIYVCINDASHGKSVF